MSKCELIDTSVGIKVFTVHECLTIEILRADHTTVHTLHLYTPCTHLYTTVHTLHLDAHPIAEFKSEPGGACFGDENYVSTTPQLCTLNPKT